jgi:uncharacterized protein (TIGR00251 family)
MSFFETRSDGILLRIQVVPGSSKNQIVGLHGSRLKIKLQAPPVDGKANEALLSFIAETLGAKKSDIELIRGSTSRSKDLLVKNVTEERIMRLK